MRINLGTHVVDLDNVDSPSDLLRIMLYTLGSQAVIAMDAAEQFLKDGTNSPALAQQMITTAGTVGGFIWPLPSRKARLKAAYPRRGEDLQELMGLADHELALLKNVRDSLVHIDERIEAFFLDHPGDTLQMWVTSVEPPIGGSIMNYNPQTQVITFQEHALCVPDLYTVLRKLQERSMHAFFLMLQVTDVVDKASEEEPGAISN